MIKHKAVVTGGSRGVGRAIVDRLSAEGSEVLTIGRGPRPDDLPDSVLWLTADVSNVQDVQRVIAEADNILGAATLLVNNARVQVDKTVPDTTDDDWELLMGVNCRGVFNMCRAWLPKLTVNGGLIINIGSVSGTVEDPSTAVYNAPSMAVYNASKAFVEALTRSIAIDHGPRVRCNAVSPGWVETDVADHGSARACNGDALRPDALARLPLERFGHDPTDIADTVSWLASHEARYVTGQVFTVDGGLTAASPVSPGLFR